MKIRRVVTGHTPNGKATVASDTVVDAITIGMLPGAEFHRLWGADKRRHFQTPAHRDPRRPISPRLGDFDLASSPSDQTR